MTEINQSLEGLPIGEFAFPGPLRDKLVAAILSGEKTATASLEIEYRAAGEDPHDQLHRREVVVNSEGTPVCIIENTAVELSEFGAIDDAFAQAEGEGFTTAAQWATAHREFWESEEFREETNRPSFTVTSSTVVVCVRFKVVQVL